MKTFRTLFFLCIALIAASCIKATCHGNLDVRISYTANGEPLVTDTLAYTNEAGNRYLVTEVQWFISNVSLCDENGDTHPLGHIFYIDTNIPESQTLTVASLPCGHYTTLRFTFGLDQEDNVTGLFVNPPENNMFWPEALGGGYHYMKLNGKYLDASDNLVPLNIHLGIGQNADHTQFYQNYFTVELPIDINIKEGENHLFLDMNIDHWFCNPHVYDFNTFGSAIMQNQKAQCILKENGNDVFSTINHKPMKTLSEIGLQIMRMSAPEPHFFTWNNLKNHLENLKDRL